MTNVGAARRFGRHSLGTCAVAMLLNGCSSDHSVCGPNLEPGAFELRVIPRPSSGVPGLRFELTSDGRFEGHLDGRTRVCRGVLTSPEWDLVGDAIEDSGVQCAENDLRPCATTSYSAYDILVRDSSTPDTRCHAIRVVECTEVTPQLKLILALREMGSPLRRVSGEDCTDEVYDYPRSEWWGGSVCPECPPALSCEP